MPRTKGKVNYNIPKLTEVIEEKLPQGSMGLQEVSALYQLRPQEEVLRDHEDIKRYWVEKLCNKFKNQQGTLEIRLVTGFSIASVSTNPFWQSYLLSS